jgi:histidinol phosphatase-like PHP family hydrolase/predicted phosphodiesterase
LPKEESENPVRKPVTMAVIADVHYGEDSPGSRRRCSVADVLLERAVRRINRMVRPDVVLVLGDLVDDGNSVGAEERLQTLRGILEKLDCPYLAIPGNHDGDPDQFFRVFPRPKPVEEIGGVRFLAFVDSERPGYNASRCAADIERFRAAREGYGGPLVALQHVCLFPPERDVAPYNYINAAEIIETMKGSDVMLSVSGHHHHGAENCEADGVTFVNAPGLCEAPFPFLEITIDGDRIDVQRHELAMSGGLDLVDNHLHTELAYCSENMTVPGAIALAKEFGLAGISFTEHAGQLYFDRKPYWRNVWLEAGVDAADASHNRMPAYLELKRVYQDDFARFSLEVECDVRGDLVLDPDDRRYFQWTMGTVHALPGLTREAPPRQRDLDDFLYLVDAMGKEGVRVLAHPMRIFRRLGWEAPAQLFDPTARLLREHGVAAEINFHTNEPPVEFVRCCLEQGVEFSFGSDAHNLAEIGDFAYHVALLREAGFDGDFSDILVTTR